ncbi:putative uncharacterized protein DDB_G0286901 [Metopolophium dirhodum]|uniref:putative uncharacterized protein DDB_G0286901 n=1 Tax=Metopolophium dirhodum TaxID=44670 RepID=UPI00298FAD12|nr:putative uncharacterized protein DDB_G0286901 [Metopolophium dirhodum]
MSQKDNNTSLTDSETESVQLINQESREVVLIKSTSSETINNKDSELSNPTSSPKETKNDTNNDITIIADNKELLIDLSTEEGYQYSIDFDREKYLGAIREKNLLNTSIRPIIVSETELRQIGTRTQKGIIHTQLEPVKRTRKTKMPTKIPLDKATLMIPTCTGERDVYQFIKASDLACSAVEKDDLPILMKFINTKLFDQALNVCRYRDTSDWEGIKLILLDHISFEPQQSTSSLQVALNSVRMRNNEDVGAYARRVEQLYFNLCVASTKGKTTDQADTIRDQLKEQTLVVFIKGLIPSLKTIVKSQKPPTLELAIQVAKDEETEIKSETDAYQYYGGNSSGRQVNNSTANTSNSNGQNNNYNAPNINRPNYNSNNLSRPNYNLRGNFNPNPNFNRSQYNRNTNLNRPDINHGNRNNVNSSNQYQPRGNNNFNRNNNYTRNYQNNNHAMATIQCYQCGGNHFARDCVQNRHTNN